MFKKRSLIQNTALTPLFYCYVSLLSTTPLLYQYLTSNTAFNWPDTVISFFVFAQLWLFFYEIVLYIKFLFINQKKFHLVDDNYSLKEYPTIAFIIPSFHEPFDVCKMTYDSVRDIPYPGNKEIIIVDNSKNIWSSDFIQWQEYVESQNQTCNTIESKFIYNNEGAGLKPGNLDCAHKHLNSAKYVVILDVDSTLPQQGTLLEDSVKQFEKDSTLGWLQYKIVSTNHHFNACGHAVGIMQTLQRSLLFMRSLGGTTLFLGHNAMWRRSCLDEIGPWLEYCRGKVMITEDVLKCIQGYTKGYYGKCTSINTGEWVPTSLESFENMWMRWSYGSCQIVSKYFGQILATKNMFLTEKIDLIQQMITFWGVAFLLPVSAISQLFVSPAISSWLIFCFLFLPRLISGFAIYKQHIRHQKTSTISKIRHLYTAQFIIPVFVYSVCMKATIQFLLNKPCGWKVTNKKVEDISPWWTIVYNNLFYIGLILTLTSLTIASWFINSNRTIQELVPYTPMLFFILNLMLTIVLFGKSGRDTQSDIQLATIDTCEMDVVPAHSKPAFIGNTMTES